MKNDIKKLEERLEKERDRLWEAHMVSVQSPQPQMQTQLPRYSPPPLIQPTQMNQTVNIIPPLPPSNSAPFLPPSPPKLTAKAKGFVKEMNKHFKDGILKPSQIAKGRFKEIVLLPNPEDQDNY